VGICGPAVFSMHELLKDLKRGGPMAVDLGALYDSDLNPGRGAPVAARGSDTVPLTGKVLAPPRDFGPPLPIPPRPYPVAPILTNSQPRTEAVHGTPTLRVCHWHDCAHPREVRGAWG